MKINIFKAFVAMIILSVAALWAGTNPVHVIGVTVGMVTLTVAMHVFRQMNPCVSLLTIEIPDFTEKSEEDVKKMSAEAFKEYLEEKNRHTSAVRRKETHDLIMDLKKEDGDIAKLELLEEQMETLIKETNHAMLAAKQANEKATREVPVGIKQMLINKKDEIAAFVKSNSGTYSLEIDIKAQQNPADIGNRTDFAQMLPGVDKIPHRRTYIKDRITIIPTNKEFVKYLDQDTLVRDAKNVAQCGVSAHNTKLTWTTRTLQTTKVRDLIDICIDMMDDYDFVEGEIRELLNVDLQLKIDSGLLLDDGINPNLASIDFYSSTFNAANPDANYALAVQAATVIDLIVVASAQIMEFGKQGFFMADTVYINPRDYTLLKLIKDQDDNYIKSGVVDPRVFQDRNGNLWIDGVVLVLPNPNVPSNEFYIFDSTKGKIYQRKTAVIEFSFENKSNFENEVVTAKVYERLNLLVKNNQKNAFMHIPDIAASVVAITKL